MEKILKRIVYVGGAVLLFCLFVFRGAAAEMRLGMTGDSLSLRTQTGDFEVSDLSALLSETAGGAEVCFDGVSLSEDVYLSGGDFVFLGDADFGSCDLYLVGGASLTVAGDLTFSGGQIRIYDADLTLSSGSVRGTQTPIALLGYGTYTQCGGEVVCASGDAVVLSGGAAVLRGGSITAQDGVCVRAGGALTLAGAVLLHGRGYEICTGVPIYASDETGAFSGSARVLYGGEFSVGEFTPVVLRAGAGLSAGFSVADAHSVPAELSFYERAPVGGFLSVLGVGKPYTLRASVDGRTVCTESYYRGQKATLPTPAAKSGYEFVGWYLDGCLRQEPIGVFSDMELCGVYRLAPPEFTLSDLRFPYDGETHTLTFERLSHPLSDTGSFSFEWSAGGVPVGSGAGVDIRTVADSGIYCCTVTFTHGEESVRVRTPDVRVCVDRRVICVPSLSDLVYTGALQYGAVGCEDYTVADAGAVGVGEYSVLFSLTDAENTVFSEGGSTLTRSYFVLRATNVFLSSPAIADVYEGETLTPSAVSLFGTPAVLFAAAGGEYSPSVPDAPGDYFCVFSVPGTQDYTSLESDPIPFRILADSIVSVCVRTSPDQTEYEALSRFCDTGLVLCRKMTSGREFDVPAAQISYTYPEGRTCFYVGDTFVRAECFGMGIEIPVRVRPITYAVGDLCVSLSDLNVTFDGTYHTPRAVGTLPSLADGGALCVRTEGGGTHAGSYPVRLYVQSSSDNYTVLGSIEATLTVAPCPVLAVYDRLTFVYDTRVKKPNAVFTDVSGVSVPLNTVGEATDAGSGYTVRCECSDPDYRILNPTEEFTVERACFDLSGVAWDHTRWVYDGEEHLPALLGLPDALRIVGYLGRAQSQAGNYRVGVSFFADEKNYVLPEPLYTDFSVVPAAYDTDGVFAAYSEIVYDGEGHTPTPGRPLPTGADGVPLCVAFDRTVTHVEEGAVAVRATFSTESENYVCPEPRTYTVRILPKTVRVSVSEDTFFYDGNSKAPIFAPSECALIADGAEVHAGTYTVRVRCADSDHVPSVGTVTYRILPTPVRFLSALSVPAVFEGRKPAPEVIWDVGEVRFEYSSCATFDTLIDPPHVAGTYYVRAVALGDADRTASVSPTVCFTVLPVLPVALEGSVRGLVALTVPTGDMLDVRYRMNDGTLRNVAAEDLTVDFGGRDYPLAGENVLTVRVGLFTLTLEAEAQSLRVPLPALSPLSFTGTLRTPAVPPSPYYSVTENNGGIHAGTYSLTLSLADPENTEFAGTAETNVNICYQILPKILPYEVSDITRFRDGVTDPFTGKYTGEGECPTAVTLREEGGYIYAHTEDPDYCLSYEPGRVLLSRRLSVAGRECLLLCLLFLFTGLFALVTLLYVLRRRVRARRLLLSAQSAPLLYSLGHIDGGEDVPTPSGTEEKPVLPHSPTPDADAPAVPDGDVQPPYERTEDEIDPAADVTVSQEDENEPSDSDPVPLRVEEADRLMTDALASALLETARRTVRTHGHRRVIVNVDTLSSAFAPGASVDINALKEKGLCPRDAGYVKVLARGTLDKPLCVLADAFSLPAVKMIALCGGEAVIVTTEEGEP